MSQCEEIKDRISDYLEGILESGEKLNFEQHCKECLECNSILKGMRVLSVHLNKLEKIKTSDSFQAVLKSRLRLEVEQESITIIDKIILFFQTKTLSAVGYSLAALLFFAYLSYDVYYHLGNETIQPVSSSATQSPSQELLTIIPDQKPIVFDQGKTIEQYYFILEEVQDKDLVRNNKWDNSESNSRFEQQWPFQTDVDRNQFLQTNLQTVTF